MFYNINVIKIFFFKFIFGLGFAIFVCAKLVNKQKSPKKIMLSG